MLVYEFTSSELERAKWVATIHFIESFSPKNAETPIGILLGGQPASGKTAIISYLREKRKDLTLLIINGDELRTLHPRYNAITLEFGIEAPHYTQPFSNALVNHLKYQCLSRGLNFIIEGTMRTSAVIENTALELKKAGFRCEGHVLAVAWEDSTLGIAQRYEQELALTGIGRFSALDIHNEAYRKIPINLNIACQQKWLDRVVVYARTKDYILEEKVFWHTELSMDFEAVFNQLRQPLKDRSYYYKRWFEVAEMAGRRRESNASYMRLIESFIKRYEG